MSPADLARVMPGVYEHRVGDVRFVRHYRAALAALDAPGGPVRIVGIRLVDSTHVLFDWQRIDTSPSLRGEPWKGTCPPQELFLDADALRGADAQAAALGLYACLVAREHARACGPASTEAYLYRERWGFLGIAL